MISLNFYLAVSIYIFIFVSIILLVWLFERKEKDKEISLDPRLLWFCSVCTYTYINTKDDTISVCPRCGNYNKK